MRRIDADLMSQYREQLAAVLPTGLSGTVVESDGATIAVAGFPAPLGAVARVGAAGGQSLEAEVIGFRDRQTLIAPLAGVQGVRRGDRVFLARSSRTISIGRALLGRVIDAHGRPLDGRRGTLLPHCRPLHAAPPAATQRPRIDAPLSTGVRAIDGMLTVGLGQRLGIFAGSGVGKSILLGMMARNTAATVRVVALIGERGREVNEFIERDLGSEGMRHTVVVVATSDQPAIVRVQAVLAATAVAEFFRDSGNDVLLLVDSLTRLAMAQREIGLAAGEPPTTRGYPPSVFSLLPRVVERAGRSPAGSITGFYSVLVEGDDLNEPVSDAVRGLLDGHVVLSRELAARGHYPAIDVLGSISRVMPDVTSVEHQGAVRALRQLMSTYREHADLIAIGAYQRGGSPAVDLAIDAKPRIDALLQQSMREGSTVDAAWRAVIELARDCRAVGGQANPES